MLKIEKKILKRKNGNLVKKKNCMKKSQQKK